MYCPSCGAPNDDSAKFCAKGGSQLSSAAGPIPPPPPPNAGSTMRGGTPVAGPKTFATGKNPPVAMILSILIPGVGQFYNGDMKKGAVMLAAAIVGGVITVGLVWLGILIWS